MSELVVIVSDLYFGMGSPVPVPARDARVGALPGLERMARYGVVDSLAGGWRSWLAASIGRSDLASASPAAIAAASLALAGSPGAAELVWLADPVHLFAGMTSLHLPPQGLLQLEPPEQAQLCADFDESFAALGYRLLPTRTGRFLARGPALAAAARTTEPARLLGSRIAEALPQGPGAAALLTLGAEIEMWLHEHPLNRRRARAGLPPVSTLWLWGGGAPLDGGVQHPGEAAAAGHSPTVAVFSDDAYMAGLAHLGGARLASEPRDLAQVAATRAARRIVTLELFGARPERDAGRGGERADAGALAGPDALRSGADSVLSRLEAFDRDWLVPALRLLARRELARLTLIANDRRVSLSAVDRMKVWRRGRGALEALQ